MKTKPSLLRTDRLLAALVALLALFAAPQAEAQLTTNVFFFDDFTDANGTNIGSATNAINGTSYLWSKAGVATNSTIITNNTLSLGTGGVSGRDWATAQLTNTSGFNTTYSNSTASTLEWYFNMRTTRADSSGFDAGGYGSAFIIGASSSALTNSGTAGYAIVIGQSSSTDPIRFVSFANGITNNNDLTTLITATNVGADIGNQFLSLKLTYAVSTSLWSLSGSTNSSFVDPFSNGSMFSLGATNNTTYTGSNLSFVGAFWNHGTGASDSTTYDNFRIASITSSMPAENATFWTANGSTLGGAGTWDTSGSNWSSATSPVSGGVWDSTTTAVFTNNAATVTVSTVSANAGMQFATDGYALNSGTITLGGSAIASNTITTDTGITATINSVLSGSAGMTKAGAGTLVLGGTNNYTGGTLISAGVLQGDTISLQGTITNSGSIVFNQSTNGAYGSVLSGSGTLIKIGASTLTLSGANGFTGAMSISNGAVRLANNTGSGTAAGGITVASGAALELSNNIAVGAEALNLNGSGISSGGALRSVSGSNSYAGVITNTGSVTIAADSGSAMTLSGAVNLNTGTMTVGGDGNTLLSGAVTNGSGSVTKSGAGTVTFSNTSTSFGTLTTGTGQTAFATNAAITGLAGSGALNLVGGTLTLSNTIAQSFSGAISGAGGLTKRGSSTLTLSAANTFSGSVAVNGGVLALTNGSALADTAAVTLASTAGVVLEVDQNETIGSLAGGGATGGSVALDTNTLTLNQSGNTTYTGAINGTGILAKSGSGTLTFNQADAIGTDFDMVINGGTIDFNRAGSAIGVLLGTGNTIQLNGGTVGFTSSSAANGAITNGGIFVTADSTILIARTASQSHSTTITAPLSFSNNANLTFAYNANVTAGTTTFAGANNTLNSDATITLTNYAVTISGPIGEAGGSRALTKAGAGTLILAGANTYTGDTVVSDGVLSLSGSGRIADGSLVVVSSDATMNFTNISDTVKGVSGAGTVSLGSATLTTSNAATDTFSGTLAGTGAYTKVGAGTQVLSGAANSYSGTTTVGGGTLQVSTLANSNSNSSIGSGSSVVLTNGGVLDYTGSTVAINRGVALSSGNGGIGVSNAATGLTLSGAITGTGNLVKSGSGTLTLTGANTFTGALNVHDGTLEIASINNNSANGPLGNSTNPVSLGKSGTANVSTLLYTGGTASTTKGFSMASDATAGVINVANSGTTLTVSGPITGSSGSGLTKTGIGRLSLSGSSSYNGATTVSAGDLNLSGGSIASSAVTVASGASLSGYGSVGTIGGAGAINPGNSPGILTTPQVDPSGETDFNLEMTGTAPTYNNAANSVNDVIRITGATPFSEALVAGNGINIYFSGAALFTGVPKTITGGFFTDQSASFASSISGATYTYYFANASGTNSYNGASYYNKAQYESLVLGTNMSITVTTVAQTANFGSGDISGQVMQVQVIPEPSTYALLGLSAAAFGAYRWRRRRG